MTLRLASPVIEDYAYLAKRMRPDEVDQFLAMSGMKEYSADACARAAAGTQGPAYTYLDPDGRPVLVGGFDPLRPGVYEGWHISTVEGWEKHWRSFTKISIRLMDDLLANGAHRIQTCALASRTLAHRWYERSLGMVNEGVQHRYCADGSDAVMFARVNP